MPYPGSPLGSWRSRLVPDLSRETWILPFDPVFAAWSGFGQLQKWRQPQKKDNLKNEVNLKNEDNLKKEDIIKMKKTQKWARP